MKETSEKQHRYTSEKEFYKVLNEHTPPSHEQMEILIDEYHKGNKDAKDEIIYGNLRLLVAPAKRYACKSFNLEFMDFIQEGVLSLVRSIETYDPEKGAFSTYAIKMLEIKLYNYWKEKERDIKESGYIREKYYKYIELIKKEKDLKEEEICVKLGISQEILEYFKIKPYIQKVSSNQKMTEDEDASTLEDFLIAEDELSPEEQTINQMSEDFLFAFLRYILSQKDYYITYYRMLIPNKIHLSVLGKEFGTTRENICQKQSKIKNLLEKYFKNGKKLYYETLRKIDFKTLERMKRKPLNPRAITTYLYVRDFLNDQEYNIYYLLNISKEQYTLEEIASQLNIPYKDTKESEININTIVNHIDQKEFEKFHSDLITRLGPEIYDFAVFGAKKPADDYVNHNLKKKKK